MILNVLFILCLFLAVSSSQSTPPDFQSVSGEFAQKWIKDFKEKNAKPVSEVESDKSEGNGIFLADTPSEIRKKVMRAVTDAGPEKAGSEPSEAVKNLFTIMDAVSESSTVEYFREKHASCEIRYGDMKKQLAEDIIKVTEPIRVRINEIINDPDYLGRVVAMGAEKARASAAATIREVRQIIGYRPF